MQRSVATLAENNNNNKDNMVNDNYQELSLHLSLRNTPPPATQGRVAVAAHLRDSKRRRSGRLESRHRTNLVRCNGDERRWIRCYTRNKNERGLVRSTCK